VICGRCGGSFRQTTGKQRFCSDRCRYAARDRKRHVQRGTRVAATCRRCGAGFVYVSKTKPPLYCSACSPGQR
jgi:hypothetical protein